MRKPRLVPEWRKAWRMLSMQSSAINAAFLTTWAMLPSKFQDALPLPWVLGIAVGLIVTGMAFRLIKQDKVRE